MRSNNKRHLILEAAFAVVAEQGANRLTIDAVAAESGFSKGGVLYHFATKHELLKSMLDYLVDANLGRIHESGGGVSLPALIEARQGTNEAEQRASLALLTAFAEDRALLDPIKDQFSALYKESVGSSANDDAAILFFANEGLRFLELFGVSPLTRDAMAKLSETMAGRAEGLP